MPNVYPAVVRLYQKDPLGIKDFGYCSGTIVRRGLILTAGHCLYEKGQFLSSSFGCAVYAVPAANLSGSEPYGGWCVERSWVPTAYINGDSGYDWGIAYIGPDSSGNYVGDYTGNLNAYWNTQFPLGTHIMKIGYPAEGWFVQNYNGGDGQYFCENDYEDEAWSDPVRFTGYMIYVKPCEMNGGSSGGPAIVYFPDVGEWGIVGVNNWAHRGPAPDTFGQDSGSFYLDSRFGSFWNNVIAEAVASGL